MLTRIFMNQSFTFSPFILWNVSVDQFRLSDPHSMETLLGLGDGSFGNAELYLTLL